MASKQQWSNSKYEEQSRTIEILKKNGGAKLLKGWLNLFTEHTPQE